MPHKRAKGSFAHWEKVSAAKVRRKGRMRAEFIWQPDESAGSGVSLVRVKGTKAATKIVYLK